LHQTAVGTVNDMPIHFSNVEVIELPVIAGANHPSQRFLVTHPNDSQDYEALDSACIALGWKPQSRIIIEFETFEQGRGSPTRKGKKGKLQRLSRAVKKRILRQSGVATSDIESEDERVSRKPGKKKKKLRIPGTKAMMKTFSSSQDRFCAQPVKSYSPLWVTRRARDESIPKFPDAMPKVPKRWPISPIQTIDECPSPVADNATREESEPSLKDTGNVTAVRANTQSILQAFSPMFPQARKVQSPEPTVFSINGEKPKQKPTVRRKIEFDIVTFVKQPTKAAKNRLKLSKLTRKRLIEKDRFSDDFVDWKMRHNESQVRQSFPSLHPFYILGASSKDGENLLADDSNRSQEIVVSADNESIHDRTDLCTTPHCRVKSQYRSNIDHIMSTFSTPTKQLVTLDNHRVKLTKSTRRHYEKRSAAGEGKVQASYQSQRSLCVHRSSSSDKAIVWFSAHSTRVLSTVDGEHPPQNLTEDVLLDERKVFEHFPVDFFAAIPPPPLFSPGMAVVKKGVVKNSRRSGLGCVVNAIGAMAYHSFHVPVKLAKTTQRLKEN
jgi:hypothetical protein